MKVMRKSSKSNSNYIEKSLKISKMKESENIAAYLLRIDEVFNSIIELGEEVNESIIVQKTLRSLPLRYDAKVSSIEESRDLTKMRVDELHGILITYEMRIET
jgi:hypothetical protein